MMQFASAAECHEKQLSDCSDHPVMDEPPAECSIIVILCGLHNCRLCAECPNYVMCMNACGSVSAYQRADIFFAVTPPGVATPEELSSELKCNNCWSKTNLSQI